MLVLVIRKMMSNPWMILCLLVGSIIAVAMVAAIPIYTDGVLQRMLIRDLEIFQEESYYFPGRYNLRANFNPLHEDRDVMKLYHTFDNMMSPESVSSFVKIPILSHTKNIYRDYLKAEPAVQREEKPKYRSVKLEVIQGLPDHINILHGRLYSMQQTDETYEVIVTEQAMQKLDLLLNEVYLVSDILTEKAILYKVKIVGVFTVKDKRDPFWFKYLNYFSSSFFMDYSLFNERIFKEDISWPFTVQWDYAFDYHKLSMDSAGDIIEAYESQRRFIKQLWMPDLKVPAIPILIKYKEREKEIRITLWVLQVPILLMLAFYVFMVSQLIVEREKNEIAVFKSRGSSGYQVFSSYLLESFMLGFLALLAGPPFGLFLCKILGTSNGFLEFVQRTALPLRLSLKAYFYSFWAVTIFMAAMLLPAYLASRTTIVLHKQKKARFGRTILWKKIFLDIILLAVAGYGLYQYHIRQTTLELTGASGTELVIDPLLYLISTLFILGAGLFFLRIFPYLVRLIFWTGRRVWSPVFYSSLIRVGRAGSHDQFLMLFLMLTLAIGVFNAGAARTLNANTEEKIFYERGADITLQAKWESNEPPKAGIEGGEMPGGAADFSQDLPIKKAVIYKEPPFLPYTMLSGVESATKVFIKKSIAVQSPDGKWIRNVGLMAIIPHEFGITAWFRHDLLPYHWYKYLNLLTQDPTAVLLSRSFQTEHNIELGESIWFQWEGQGYLEGTVYAFIDYWPTYNPVGSMTGSAPKLIVANLPYIHAKMALEPYEVWLKKEPGATSSEVYEDIDKQGLKIEELVDADQDIIKRKNDPMLQGTNGSLTLGFVVTIAITIIGFLIYWIISIQGRALQFGVFRAIGLSKGKIIGILTCEQILVSGIPILMGSVIGGIASELFVPLLQVVHSAATQIPPFKVVANPGDYIKIYAVISLMLIVGLSILSLITSRIRIHQAVKLGEE